MPTHPFSHKTSIPGSLNSGNNVTSFIICSGVGGTGRYEKCIETGVTKVGFDPVIPELVGLGICDLQVLMFSSPFCRGLLCYNWYAISMSKRMVSYCIVIHIWTAYYCILLLLFVTYIFSTTVLNSLKIFHANIFVTEAKKKKINISNRNVITLRKSVVYWTKCEQFLGHCAVSNIYWYCSHEYTTISKLG